MLFLTTREGLKKYNEEILNERTTILDVLDMFPSCTPSFAHLLQELPSCQPRYYSATTSPSRHPNELHIAYSVVKYTTPKGRTRKGVCTHWLKKICEKAGFLSPQSTSTSPPPSPLINSTSTTHPQKLQHNNDNNDNNKTRTRTIKPLSIGGCVRTTTHVRDNTVAGGGVVAVEKTEIQVLAFLRRSCDFRVPEDLSVPMIMIGPGTGVAPFRGFLQHRQDMKAALDTGGASMGWWRGMDDMCNNEDNEVILEGETTSSAYVVNRNWTNGGMNREWNKSTSTFAYTASREGTETDPSSRNSRNTESYVMSGSASEGNYDSGDEEVYDDGNWRDWGSSSDVEEEVDKDEKGADEEKEKENKENEDDKEKTNTINNNNSNDNIKNDYGIAVLNMNNKYTSNTNAYQNPYGSPRKTLSRVESNTDLAAIESSASAAQANLASVCTHTKTTVGKSILFFGCRRRDEDYLYEKDWGNFLKDETLTKLSCAFSREVNCENGMQDVVPQKKVYVQDRLRESGMEVVDMIMNKGARIYVCGDGLKMAKEVMATIVELLKLEGGVQDAEQYMHRMLKEKMYVQDIWG